MPDAAKTLGSELVAVLTANSARLCDGLQAELARPVDLEEGRPLQFEADPCAWGISSCASEESIIDDEWLWGALPGDWIERAEEAGINWDAMLSDAVCAWFADCWQAVGGPVRFSPAYLFLHGYHQQQYDLERRCWIPVEVAFGE
jgi:hypothetical protein